MRCPHCQNEVEPSPVKFTWWGGVLGPKMFSHVACPQCRGRFNGKTGKSNNTAITIYVIVISVMAGFAGYALMGHH
jgi:hypothetical protein